MSNKEIWRDITDPRRAEYVDDLEAGLKEPEFENLQIPEHLGPVQEKIDDHKIKRYAFEIDEYNPWFLEKSPFLRRFPRMAASSFLYLSSCAISCSRIR